MAPTPLNATQGVVSWSQLAAGAEHTCGIANRTSNYQNWAYCWGAASFGRLGLGRFISSSETAPQPVAAVGGVVAWKEITAGSRHRSGGQAAVWASLSGDGDDSWPTSALPASVAAVQ